MKTFWVQTERESHIAWANLVAVAPRSAQLLHLLTAKVGENNAVVISHKTMAALMGVKSVTTVKTAISTLVEGRWMQVVQIGDRGSVNAYVLNDKVVWHGPRSGLRHSMFSATIVASEVEQPVSVDSDVSLRKVPLVYDGELQLPENADGSEIDLPQITKT